MSDFFAYFWDIEDVSLPHRDAVNQLCAASGPPRLAAFARLLESGDTAACGIALDQFFYAEASSRFGVENGLAALSAQLRRVARDLLARSAVLRQNQYTGGSYAANHASALGALMHLGTPEDLERLRPFLDPSLDTNVFSAACMAVDQCVDGAADDAIAAVRDQLLRIVQNEALAEDVRDAAIAPIRRSEALVAVAPLLEIARGPSLRLAIQAVWALAGRDDVDGELRGIVASWPEDAPYPASEVRELLGLDV